MKTMEENMQKIKMGIILTMLLLQLTACQLMQQETAVLEQADIDEAQGVQDAEKDTENIYVYVCGAVNVEGVYALPVGSRVYEAIEMAGGFREDAAASEMNQAEILEDATRLYIPSISEMMDHQEANDGKVNINKATREELMTLPGVGASKADSIIQYREKNGTFKTIEEIMQISGIKEGLFNKIKDYIKVN